MKKSIFIAILTVMLISLSACSNTKDKVQGNWQGTDDYFGKVELKIKDNNVSMKLMDKKQKEKIKDLKDDKSSEKFIDGMQKGKIKDLKGDKFTLVFNGEKIKGKVDGDTLDLDGEKFKKK